LVKKAFRENNAFLHQHCLTQMKKRGIEVADIENAIAWARSIEPYPQGFEDLAFEGGEAWRLSGPSLQDDTRSRAKRTIRVGVYIVAEAFGGVTIVVTVF